LTGLISIFCNSFWKHCLYLVVYFDDCWVKSGPHSVQCYFSGIMTLCILSYWASLAIWDHTELPATQHKWTHPA